MSAVDLHPNPLYPRILDADVPEIITSGPELGEKVLNLRKKPGKECVFLFLSFFHFSPLSLS